MESMRNTMDASAIFQQEERRIRQMEYEHPRGLYDGLLDRFNSRE